MKRLVIGRDHEVADWVNTQIDEPGDFYPCTAIGIEDDSGLFCGVVYNLYYPAISINMHVAASRGRKWAYPHFLRAFFAYPFQQLHVQRITAPIASRNIAAIKLTSHLGFIQEGIVRKGTLDDDLIIMGMLREECRFLGESYGQEIPKSPRSSFNCECADEL